jgi:phosphatidylserine/phosphatidylglycerophosphate/cardiolipin synthase-like enzyme
MRRALPSILSSLLLLSACGDGPPPASQQPALVIQPDDGRGPILDAIAEAKHGVRLTIYAITDLQAVPQTPVAPAASVAQALIDKARSGVSVRVIVDQDQATAGGHAAEVQATIAQLQAAGAVVQTSSSTFCFTHQKTFLIDGPTAASPDLPGLAVIMSLNLTPGYFGGTRDYAVVTRELAVLQEVSRVFESDFALVSPGPGAGCQYAHAAAQTVPPPEASDTPTLAVDQLVWSPVNSKPRLLGLIASTRHSLALTTEELTDPDVICALQDVASSAARPFVRIILSGDTGSNAAGVKHLIGLGLWNLEIRIMPGRPSTPGLAPLQTPLYMHGKQVIADGVQAWLGSENLTNTSLLQNRELGYLFSDAGMIARLLATFEADFTTLGASLPAEACTGGSGCTTVTCPASP